jgi:hypothetical protein
MAIIIPRFRWGGDLSSASLEDAAPPVPYPMFFETVSY